MADYTDDDVTRLAEMLTEYDEFTWQVARRLLEQGVTLPPPSDDDLRAVIWYGMEAIRLPREYVQPTVNPPAIEGWSWFDWVVSASAALDEDVPQWAAEHAPPDPAAVVAEALYKKAYGQPWVASAEWARRLVAAVRDLFTPAELAAAAAKVQEAEG